jgi:hypothetical protein
LIKLRRKLRTIDYNKKIKEKNKNIAENKIKKALILIAGIFNVD